MKSVERHLEDTLFASRWLAAPIYLGLVFCLIMLLVVFIRYLVMVGGQLMVLTVHQAAVATLAFIDLALLANLVLIVIFVGYENFVSKLEIDEHADRPGWIGDVDYSGLKMKLFTSLVAITGIDLLKAFMDLQHVEAFDQRKLMWLLIIHVTFLFTLMLSAVAIWLMARAKPDKPATDETAAH